MVYEDVSLVFSICPEEKLLASASLAFLQCVQTGIDAVVELSANF